MPARWTFSKGNGDIYCIMGRFYVHFKKFDLKDTNTYMLTVVYKGNSGNYIISKAKKMSKLTIFYAERKLVMMSDYR
jgi:hypothetical protein